MVARECSSVEGGTEGKVIGSIGKDGRGPAGGGGAGAEGRRLTDEIESSAEED